MTSSIDNIIVLDTETTGIDPAEGAALLEVAWVSMERARVGAGFVYGQDGTYDNGMVTFTGTIPPEAKAVHHITEDMVAAHGVVSGGERPTQCYDRSAMMHSLCAAESPGDMMYAAHNAAFDMKFLPELTLPWICTYRCALHLYPDAPKHSNQVLRYWLGVEPPAAMLRGLAPHRAAYDTAVTAAILSHMLETHTPEELLALTSAPVLLKTCRFGKHRGDPWSEVPRSYLQWMLAKSDLCAGDPDLAHTVRHHLDGR